MFTPLCFGPSFRFWRLLLSGADESGAYQICSDLELRESVGGSDAANGGTATASNTQSGHPISNAFDTDTGTLWSSGTTGTTTEWIQYAFLAPVNILEISYRSNTLFNTRGPTQIELQRSSDGTSGWTTVKTWTSLTGWTTSPRVLQV